MPAPTLLQTLLNRPTQSYSARANAASLAEPAVEVPTIVIRTGGADERHTQDLAAPAGHPIALSRTPRSKALPSLPLTLALPTQSRPRVQSTPTVATRTAPSPSPSPRSAGPDDGNSSGSEAFYTPGSSPAESPGQTTPVDPRSQSPPQLIISDVHSKFVPRPSSSASGSTSISDDTFSEFSWARSESSRTSENTHSAGRARKPKSLMATEVLTAPSHAFPQRISPPKQRKPDWARDVRWLVAPAPLAAPTSSSPPVATRQATLTSPPSRPHQYSPRSTMSRSSAKERMSALVEEADEDTIDLGEVRETGVLRNRSLSAPSKTSVQTSSRTVELPSLPATSSGVQASSGYTSLVLPLAAYTPSKNPAQDLVSNKVDLPRSGIAQTTMSSISITKNGSSQATSRAAKRMSLHGLFGNLSTPALDLATPDHLRALAPSPLAFTSSLAPPSRFGSNQVLVQVWAVALDRLDALIVQERASKPDGSGYGFIPGRGFVGRVIETGVEVSNIHRGDWVFGSFEVKKCGALCEFITVDRRRIHHIPQVFQPAPPPVQPRSRRSRVVTPPTAPPPPPLTLEHIAYLALAGVPAHRAVRGLAAAISAARYDTPPRPARALVLQGHDGVGFLAIQELVAQHVHVVAQVPPMNHDDPEGLDYVAVARAAGAAHVLVGEPEDVLDDIRDMLVAKLSWNDDGPGLAEFDCFVDTVGGKAIWDQAIHVMRDGGQFVTTVGDQRDAAWSAFTAGAHFRHNIRAMQRAFTQTSPGTPSLSGSRTPVSAASSRRSSRSADGSPSPSHSMFSSLSAGDSLADLSNALANSKSKKAKTKSKKHLGYIWVSAAADVDGDGEDVRDSLAEVARLAQAGTLRPSLLAGWQAPGASPTWTRARAIQLARRAASEESSLGLPMNIVGSSSSDSPAPKIVPFERTPSVLRLSSSLDENHSPVDLNSGGVVVVRVVG